jgi:2-hydroxychromene-2-carboxylate isomerase
MKIFLLLLSFCLLSECLKSPPLPNSYPGHVLGNPANQILFEVYFDHQCPDSKASWPVVQQVAQAYPNQVYVIVHMFPLPYHHNAFYATQAGLAIQAKTNASNWFKWLDVYFKNQDLFTNDATQDMTPNQVIASMAKLAVPLGISSQDFINGMTYGNDFDAQSRIEWKYATTRGVYGTPLFFINGIFVTDDSSWTLSQWQQVINSLLPNKH